MSKINDGGPALPSPPYEVENGISTLPQHGMSKREWFAVQVLAFTLPLALEHSRDASPSRMAAAIAVETADALIAELAKEPTS